MQLDDITLDEKQRLDGSIRDYRYNSSLVPDVLVIFDLALIAGSAALCYFILVPFNWITVEYYIFGTAFISFASYIMLRRSGLYEINAIMRPIGKSDLAIVSIGSAFLFFLTIAFSLKVSDIFSRLWLYGFFFSSVVSIVSGRVLVCQLLQRWSRQRVIGRTVIVLGTGEQAARFLQRLDNVQPFFTDVRGVFATAETSQTRVEGHPVLGGPEELLRFARSHKVDDVIVAMPWNADRQLALLVEKLKELPINVYISTDLIGYQLKFRPVFGQFTELPLFEVVQRPISGWSSLLKSLEDYIIASALLLILSPLLILVAIAIKLDSPGPVFFMQRRLGFNNETFEIFKFRSMYHRDVPETDVPQARKEDPRVTRVGRFIRKTSIDELPQLLNVLNGTMSLVGPRPHAIRHNEDFGAQIRGYFARHKVKPGITGWAQVNGLRGETDTLSKMEARVAHDIYYAENWSLLFDLRILVMTVFVVFFQKAAY
ncbi:MAG: undecaprenyl-phosphate glucose phosphotransferase [Paracoccaceae bacterium]